MKIGVMELVVIFIVALLVIGPDKLPLYAKKLGNALREFRKASADVTKEIRESVVEPLEEAQKPLREAIEPIEELNRDVNKNLRSVEKDLKNIGKTHKDESEPEQTANPAQENLTAETAPDAPAEQQDPQTDEGENKKSGGESV